MAVKVTLNDKQWSIPTRVTITEWQDLQAWQFENEAHWPWIIGSISTYEAQDFNHADPGSMQLFIGFLSAAVNRRTLNHLPDYAGLTFGQFVDLDCYLSLGIEKNIQKVLEILEVNTPWADEGLAIIDQYITWRATIYKQYADLFGLNKRGDLPNDDAQLYDPKEVSRGWYMVICELAHWDVMRFDSITAEPLHKILTFLQIKKEKETKEAMAARKITNKKR